MKKIIAIWLILAMAMSLTACGSGKAATGDGKVVLDVIISQYGNYTQAWWNEFESDFEAANEDIDLNIEIVSWNDIYSVVTTRISNNAQPDILNISGFADYVADDLLMPAEEYISADVRENFIDSFWEANEMDGIVWAVPILASCRTLFVNTDLLAGAGVEAPPTTWEEVLTACAKIRETYGDTVVPWGLDISMDEGQAAFSYYAWNFGGGYGDESGNWHLNSPENAAAVAYIKTLIDSGYCNAAPYTDTRYPLQDAFSAGTLAMMIGPMNMVASDSAINYETADIPGNGIGLAVCDQLMVFRDPDAAEQPSARTAAITRFFDAFYECETYSGYMVYEGFLPVTKDASENLTRNAENYTVGGSGAAGSSAYFTTFCDALTTCDFYPIQKTAWMDVRNGVIQVLQQVCQGLISPQEALDELQAEITGS